MQRVGVKTGFCVQDKVIFEKKIHMVAVDREFGLVQGASD
jgi:hypothetical protein